MLTSDRLLKEKVKKSLSSFLTTRDAAQCVSFPSTRAGAGLVLRPVPRGVVGSGASRLLKLHLYLVVARFFCVFNMQQSCPTLHTTQKHDNIHGETSQLRQLNCQLRRDGEIERERESKYERDTHHLNV